MKDVKFGVAKAENPEKLIATFDFIIDAREMHKRLVKCGWDGQLIVVKRLKDGTVIKLS